MTQLTLLDVLFFRLCSDAHPSLSTLFRGAADDLSLIDWLKKRIWPMEAATRLSPVEPPLGWASLS